MNHARCYEDFFNDPHNDPFLSSDEIWRFDVFEDWCSLWRFVGASSPNKDDQKHTARYALNEITDRFREENVGGIAVVVKDAHDQLCVRILHGIQDFRGNANKPGCLENKVFAYLDDVDGIDGELVMLTENLFAHTEDVTVLTLDQHRWTLLDDPTLDAIPPLDSSSPHTEIIRTQMSAFVPFEMVNLLLGKHLSPRDAFLVVEEYCQYNLIHNFLSLLDFLRVASTQSTNQSIANLLSEPGPPFLVENGLVKHMRDRVIYRDLTFYSIRDIREWPENEERYQALIDASVAIRAYHRSQQPPNNSFLNPGVFKRLRSPPSKPKSNLPHWLCEKIAAVATPISPEEELAKQELILTHVSKFPQVLRASIYDTPTDIPFLSIERRPHIFLTALKDFIRLYLFGRVLQPIGQEFSNRWYGLDDAFDTESEVEIAIRFFPDILDDRPVCPDSELHAQEPIVFLTTCPNAVSFVPLFHHLSIQYGYLETALNNRFYAQLICNTIVPREFPQMATTRLENRSLRVFRHLQKQGLVSRGNTLYLMLGLITHHERSHSFIESRLRLLIDGDPTIVRDGLFEFFYKTIRRIEPPSARSAVRLRLFRTILERCMAHYPGEIGFVFDKRDVYCAWDFITSEMVLRVVEEQLSRVLRKNKEVTRQTMFLAAASTSNIPLDVVYTLFRRDPTALVPHSTGKMKPRTSFGCTFSSPIPSFEYSSPWPPLKLAV